MFLFESFVNLEWCKTFSNILKFYGQFESFVNLEWCKTDTSCKDDTLTFESFVNLEWCKTKIYLICEVISLRALLI